MRNVLAKTWMIFGEEKDDNNKKKLTSHISDLKLSVMDRN